MTIIECMKRLAATPLPDGRPAAEIDFAAAVAVDVGGKKYVVSCNRHGTLVGASSLKRATFSALHTDDFCDDCRNAT
jgi:hypothetical protein